MATKVATGVGGMDGVRVRSEGGGGIGVGGRVGFKMDALRAGGLLPT